MARDHARIKCTIWRDADFTSLTRDAQRMFMLLLAQPKLSLCGAIDYTPARWASLCAEDTEEGVTDAIEELADAGFVAVDTVKLELVVRSFVKHDGILDSPNLVQAMWKAWGSLYSDTLRWVIVLSLPDKAFERGFGSETKDYEPPTEAVEMRSREGSPNPSPKGSRNPSATPVPVPSPETVPPPRGSDEVRDQATPDHGGTEDRINRVIELLAQQDLDRREREAPGDSIGNVSKWLASAARRRRLQDGQAVARIAESYPDYTAEEVADSFLAPKKLGKVDPASDAQQALIDRHEREKQGVYKCETCRDRGIVFDEETGLADDCECKSRKAS